LRLEYFEMTDRVLSHDATHLRAEARVPEASPVFEGHFPGFPILPGVLMIETMAQACGWLMVLRSNFTRMALLAQTREAKMRAMVKPGALLMVDVELLQESSGYAELRGALTEAGRKVAEATLRLQTLPIPAPELEAAIRARAAAIGLA
jgi:3-hydroxyacyl-[acyl-carrier-protein] dehydratase